MSASAGNLRTFSLHMSIFNSPSVSLWSWAVVIIQLSVLFNKMAASFTLSFFSVLSFSPLSLPLSNLPPLLLINPPVVLRHHMELIMIKCWKSSPWLWERHWMNTVCISGSDAYIGCTLCSGQVNVTYLFSANSFSLVIDKLLCGLSSIGGSHLRGSVSLFGQLV